MPTHNRMIDVLIPGYCKIRKRGCSSSSSTPSILNNHRFKRAIVVGKTRGGSRSTTPVPTWKMTPSSLRCPADSPKYAGSQNGGGRSRPVSARKLGATLWEMNELPSPKGRVKERLDPEKVAGKVVRAKENLKFVHSSSLRHHLSDPSHSPASERTVDRSGTGSRQKRSSLISQKIKHQEDNVGLLDSHGNASLMEIETRSRAQTPSGSTRLKDISNTLTTSKELLKILNRIWAHNNPPPSTTSLISALHVELERARIQVHQLIKTQRSDQTDIGYMMTCLAEEKAAWKKKEKQAVESAIESVSLELEVERKLRRQFESLNKKLGQELADTKASLMKTIKELESEKRAREIMEQVCDELTEDKDKQVKVVRRIRPVRPRKSETPNHHDGSEVLDGETEDESVAESDFHSIEINMDNKNKSFRWANLSSNGRDHPRASVDSVRGPRRSSSSIVRSSSEGIELEKQMYKSVKGLRDEILARSRAGPVRDIITDNNGNVGLKSRLADVSSKSRRSMC